MEKENTMNRENLSIFVAAAREIGRSNATVWAMLSDTEKDLIISEFAKPQTVPVVPVVKLNNVAIWLAQNSVHKIDRKIDVIKRVRETIGTTNVGLKEAKDFVEGNNTLIVNAEQHEKLWAYFNQWFGITLSSRVTS